jgi:hypothetical protein
LKVAKGGINAHRISNSRVPTRFAIATMVESTAAAFAQVTAALQGIAAQQQKMQEELVILKVQRAVVPPDAAQMDADEEEEERPMPDWAFLDEAELVPERDEAKLVMKMLKDPLTAAQTTKLMEEAPNFRCLGIPPTSKASGTITDAELERMEKKIATTMNYIVGTWNTDEEEASLQASACAGGVLMALATEIREVRRRFLVRGKTDVLTPKTKLGPTLLTDEEELRWKAAPRGRGYSSFRGNGRGPGARPSFSFRGRSNSQTSNYSRGRSNSPHRGQGGGKGGRKGGGKGGKGGKKGKGKGGGDEQQD